MTKTMAQNKSHCFDQGGRPSWTELERGEGTNLWRRAGEAMCSPASEAHSSGGGSRAEYREKGSCQPCKSHPETSAVESETCPAMYHQLVHQTSPHLVELNWVRGSWTGVCEQHKQEGNNTQGFSSSVVTEVPGGTYCVHREVREGEGADSRDPTGQWTKKPFECSADFPQTPWCAPTPKGASERWGRKPQSEPTLQASHGSRRYRGSGPGSRQSCVQGSSFRAARWHAHMIPQTLRSGGKEARWREDERGDGRGGTLVMIRKRKGVRPAAQQKGASWVRRASGRGGLERCAGLWQRWLSP